MNLVAIEAPAMRVTRAGEAIELLDASFGIVAASESLEIVADQLIETLAQSVSFLSSALDDLFID
jgi:hypothetical protein